jgi:outer membrane protein TolC
MSDLMHLSLPSIGRRGVGAVAVALSCGVAGSPLLAQQTVAAPGGIPSSHTITLDLAIAMAQQRGTAAALARGNRDAARWRNRAFDSRLLPQVALTGTGLDLNRGINPIPLPDGSTQFVSQSQNESNVGIGITQSIPLTGGSISVGSQLSRIDLFGANSGQYWQTTPVVIGIQQDLFKPRTLVWNEKQQALSADVAERQYLEAREDVAGSTTAQFFALYAAQMSVENAASNAAVNDTLYTLNKGRYEVGKIGENDLLKSELALLRARASLDDAKLARDRAEAALRRNLDYPANVPLSIVTPDSVPSIQPDADVAVAQALANGSSVQSSALNQVVADENLSKAKLDNRFSATVTAQFGFNQTAPVFAKSYESPLGKQRVTLDVTMPIMQWGGGHADVEAALASQANARTSAKASRDALAEEARFSALQLAQSQRNLLISAKADTVAERGFAVAKDRYVIGKIGITDLYQAQSEKDAAVLAYVNALSGYWTAYYHLRRVTLYDFATGRPLSDLPER